MLISIIVPIYNSETTLKRCIESLINQTYRDIEIILINDGSTDNTCEILEKYKKIDDRIIVVNKINGGVSSARNVGIDIAIGKYLAFVDSDDYCELDYIYRLYSTIRKDDTDLVSCGIFQESLKRKLTNKNGTFKSNAEVGSIINKINKSFVYGKLYKKDIIDSNNLKFDIDMSMGEDTLFVSSYLIFIEKGISIVEECLYNYLDASNESLSKKFYNNLPEIYEKIYNKNLEISLKFPKYKMEYPKEKLILTMDIQNLYVMDCKLNRGERIKIISKYMKNPKYRNAVLSSKALGIKDLTRKILFKIGSPKILDNIYSVAKYIILLKKNKLYK